MALLGGRGKEEACIGVGGRDDLRDGGDWVVFPDGELGGEWCFSALLRRMWVCACSLSIVGGFVVYDRDEGC